MNANRIQKRWEPRLSADEVFRAKFLTVPTILDSWISQHFPFRGADVLDFGCGEGISALALALNYEPRSVVGVDIMPDPERCLPLAQENLGLQDLPANLRLYRVAPGFLHDTAARFDVVYSWSVFEHVEDRMLSTAVDLVRSALRQGGLFFAQIAPLYFSAEGSHLMHKIPETWGHLLNQHNVYHQKLCVAVPDAEERSALWSTYRTLNRITAPELVERIKGAGFDILRTYSTKESMDPPPRLLAIYQREVLITNQIVVLARRR